MLAAFLLAIGMLCIYLEINTNYKYPLSETGTPLWGTKSPSARDRYPSEGLVMFFQYMQLYLIGFEGLADGLLSVNPSPQVTTCIIGQLIP